MIFKESQRFTQWWVWAVLFISDIIIFTVIMYAIIEQLIWGNQWGNEPMSDFGLALFSFIILTATVVANWILVSSHLESEIRNGAIYYRFKPFIWSWKKISKESIKNYEVGAFNQFLTFRGIGYRRTLANGVGLIIKGNKGLKLQYGSKNKKLTIGTQKPKELKQAMAILISKNKHDLNG